MRLPLIIGAVLTFAALAPGTNEPRAGVPAGMPSVFVSPSGDDVGRCTARSPCRSLGRAYRVASLGSVVQVAGGSYGIQNIDDDPSKDAGGRGEVVFRSTPNATASFSRLTISARHLVFAGSGLHSGFSFVGWTAMPGANDVTFRDVSTQIFGIIGATKVMIIGGQVGPWDSSPAGEDSQIKAQSGTELPPTDILISGVYFHDITKNAHPDYHTDCLQFLSGRHVVIRNNTFARCSDTDIFVRSWARGPADALSDFVIEHNVFGPTTVTPGYFDLQLADSQARGYYCNSFVFRFNVVVGRRIVFDCGPPKGDPRAGSLFGNVLPSVGSWTCSQNSATGNQPVYSHNVYADGSSAVCNSTESVARPLVILDDGSVLSKHHRLRLTYTLVAPSGTPVHVTASRGGRRIWSFAGTAPATPHAKSLVLPREVSARATRLCVAAGSPPLQRVACAAAPRPTRS